MTINVGIECASHFDIRKYNNAAMEMAIDDFFIVRMFLIMQLSQDVFDR